MDNNKEKVSTTILALTPETELQLILELQPWRNLESKVELILVTVFVFSLFAINHEIIDNILTGI